MTTRQSLLTTSITLQESVDSDDPVTLRLPQTCAEAKSVLFSSMSNCSDQDNIAQSH